MLLVEKSEDLLSISIQNLFNSRINDPKFVDLVTNWNKTIVLEFKPFQPLTIIIEGNEVKFQTGEAKKKDLKVTVSIQDILALANGRMGLISAVLMRKLRIKGIYKIGTLLKFQKIFFKTMKIVAANPNVNYYEQDKDTR